MGPASPWPAAHGGERRAGRGFGLLALALLASCAPPKPPPADVVERARGITAYSARLRVRLRGPVRASTDALVAFSRPDRLRIEVPSGAGVRVAVVVREGRLTAVFPPQRAYFEGGASAEELAALLGVRLAPAEIMDMLTGARPASVRSYAARWNDSLPSRIDAVLQDGGKLQATVFEAETTLPATAFDLPRHEAYRSVGVEEARGFWEGR